MLKGDQTRSNEILPTNVSKVFNSFLVKCTDAKTLSLISLELSSPQLVAMGTFGKVYRVKLLPDGKVRAIKKTLMHPMYRSREIEISRLLDHVNICKVEAFYYKKVLNTARCAKTVIHPTERIKGDNAANEAAENGTSKKALSGHKSSLLPTDTITNRIRHDECDHFNRKYSVYLYIVMEYIDNTANDVIALNRKIILSKNYKLDLDIVRGIMKQVFCGLEYLHKYNICHRDIKPLNILVDRHSGLVKVCDFGSAKIIQPNDTNNSYVCSRIYRAPELILNENNYSCKIDIWSSGCVLAELVTGNFLFPRAYPELHLASAANVVALFSNRDLPLHQFLINSINKLTTLESSNHALEVAKNLKRQCPLVIMDVLKHILTYPHSRRASAADILNMPFFSKATLYDCTSIVMHWFRVVA